MGKKDKGRRVYTKEFKAEAEVLAEKREKPISQIAVDLGVNKSALRRWTRQAREAERIASPSQTWTAQRRGGGSVAERKPGAAGGGVKLRFTRKPNFGHGKNHASELFCLLNVLSYLIHGIQDMADEEYRKARGSFGRRDAFFWALRYEMSRYLHKDWTDFLLTIAGEAPDDS
jgi:hypothetical protein